MLIAVLIGIAIIFLTLDSIIDLMTGEIPEKLTLGLATIIILIATVHTLYYLNPAYVGYAAIVGIAYYIMGYVLFWLGQWGGGDVKMITGIGCVFGYLDALGYSWINTTITPYYITYFINMAVIATPYAVIYTIILGLLNPHIFKTYIHEFKRHKIILACILSFAHTIASLYYNQHFLAIVYMLLPIFALASVYLKVVEKNLLCKTVSVKELQEGDIVAEDIFDGDEKLADKKNIEGITEEQLIKICELVAHGKLHSDIKIKWGVKFGPTLFLSFLVTIWFGNLLELLFHLF